MQRDVPGFVVNRVNLPSSIEAMRLVEEGVATVEDIDLALKLATGRGWYTYDSKNEAKP